MIWFLRRGSGFVDGLDVDRTLKDWLYAEMAVYIQIEEIKDLVFAAVESARVEVADFGDLAQAVQNPVHEIAGSQLARSADQQVCGSHYPASQYCFSGQSY